MTEISEVCYKQKFDCIEQKVEGLSFRFPDDREREVHEYKMGRCAH